MRQTGRLFVFILPLAIALSMNSCGEKYQYDSVEGDPMHSRIYTLDNGLKVYMAVNKETPRVQTFVAVRVGAKNDPAENTGLAHYFEHLMFKGTEKFGTQDYELERPLLEQIEKQFEVYRQLTDEDERLAVYKVIDSLSFEASKLAIPNEYDKLMSAIGSQGTNAYTGYDMTVYIEDIPSNQIDNWARIMADRFQNNVIRGFHTELETVYEEKNMSLTSDGRKVYQSVLSSLFPGHPYGTQTVLGTQEHLKNPSITTIKDYYRKWYVPNNMAICLSGDFDPDKMIATIDNYFGGMKPNPNLPHLQVKEEKPIVTPKDTTVLGLDAENVTLAWRAPKVSDTEADKFNILSSILYNGKAGLIDLNLIQQQKVLSAYGFYNGMVDHGMLLMQGRPKAGQTLEEVRTLLLGEVAKLKAGDFDEGLLEATINNYKLGIMNALDSNSGRADFFVSAFIEGQDWKDVVGQLDRMSKLTKEDIVAAANRFLGDNNYVTVFKREGKDPNESKISKPEITPIEVNRNASSDFLNEIRAIKVKPIDPVFVDFDKDVTKGKTKSGLEVLYAKNPTTDLFAVLYLFETGSNNDKAINIAANYLRYLGTDKLTPEQVRQEFYKIACSFNVSSSSERTYINLSGLSENMEKAMEIMEDLLANAQPNEEALKNLKADMLKSRADAKLNQSANFSMLRTYAMYGPKSSATNVLSDKEIDGLTTQYLLDKLKNLTHMEHRVMYYGPLAKDEFITRLDNLHKVPANLTPAPERVRFPLLETPENKVLLAQYDAPQLYYIQYSNRGEKFDVVNDPLVRMYNEYFGGGMNSIVFQEMREARGLAYSASANLGNPSRPDIPYTMVAFIATQNDKMSEAIDAFASIINDMPESDNAFEIAKEAILTGIRTNRTIKDDLLWSYISAQDLGVNVDRRRNIYDKVQTMTLADVKEFQQKWVKDRHYTYCVLGDLKDIDVDKLATFGEVKELSKEEIFGY